MTSSTKPSRLTTVLHTLAATIAAPQCMGCRRFLMPTQHWCPICTEKRDLALAEAACPACARPLPTISDTRETLPCPHCAKESSRFDAIVSLGRYRSIIGRCVRSYKYHKQLRIGDEFAERLAERLLAHAWFADIDLLVSIPTHPIRRLFRTWSPCNRLAYRLSQHLSVPFVRPLKCTRWTLPQVGLMPDERRTNVKGLFAVRRAADVKDATICIVDDVATTGATLADAARALRVAGAKPKYAAILARANENDTDLDDSFSDSRLAFQIRPADIL